MQNDQPSTLPPAALRNAGGRRTPQDGAPAGTSARARILLSLGLFANINGGKPFNSAAARLQQELLLGLSPDPEVSLRRLAPEGGNLAADGRFAVRFSLTGRLQRLGSGMRIDAKLHDDANGDCLWVERYEGAATPEFQFVVAGLIAAQLRLNLMLAKFRLRDRAPPDGSEVRPLVHGALLSFFRHTPESLSQAIMLSERALTIDPGSLRARRTLAAAMSASITLGELPHLPANLNKALALAAEVVESAPDDEIARCELAWALCNLGRHAEAAEQLQVAVGLNPESGYSRADLAEQLALLGRPNDALAQVQRIVSTGAADPLEVWRHNAAVLAHFALADYDEALTTAQELVGAEPSFVRGVLFWLASAAALERQEEVAQARAHLFAIAPAFRMDELTPRHMSPYLVAEPQDRFEAMLRRAGLA